MSAHAKITKSRSKKKPYKVSIIGENGETLMVPQLLTTNNNVVKNLVATMKAFSGNNIFVIDNSGKKEYSYTLHVDGFKQTNK